MKIRNPYSNIKKYRFILGVLLCFLYTSCTAQKDALYKQVDDTSLYLEIHSPEKMDTSKKYPAIVFFFGGGWKGGDRTHFLEHAKYFSQRGLICFLADYRTESQHGTTPFESLKDAKSAIRFVRKKATEFSVDPSQIIASGGSSGGHLAAATALVSGYNEESDDVSISSVPDALVLFNPVIDNGPGGYGYERIGDAYKQFSPLHNIETGAPPTIFFLGTEDKLIPVETAKYYQVVMQKVGSRCELKLYEGQAHGFFNYRNLKLYRQTVVEMDAFLVSLGYLEQDPSVEIK